MCEKRPGRQHDRPRPELEPHLRGDAGDARSFDDEVDDRLLEDREILRVLENRSHGGLVEHSIGLRTSGAHGRPLAGVQHAKLDSGAVGRSAHDAVECVDFLDEVALADPADRRVARHRADRFDALRQQQRRRAGTGRSRRRLGSGMTAADDDHVEVIREPHGPLPKKGAQYRSRIRRIQPHVVNPTRARSLADAEARKDHAQ
jgi:hypothetical protein